MSKQAPRLPKPLILCSAPHCIKLKLNESHCDRHQVTRSPLFLFHLSQSGLAESPMQLM
ncbi:hypothetical protein [Thalassoporum mexicanum]|uniref:hypothetical protein n=1 Tax=Thalassoporum mexicanum TaxID=3457544 RepID=UPI0012EACB69|nr:hypothetical protein [Pseudanabaena sp. PCC 7367]